MRELSTEIILETEEPFARFRDAAALAKAFQTLPAFAHLPIRHCELLNSKQRLKPAAPHKSSLVASYRLELGNKTSETVYLKAFISGCVPQALKESPNTFYLSDLDAVLWRFPFDPSLPQLPELVDAKKVKAFLPFEKLTGLESKNISELELDVVRYKPEDRCICRYQISGEKSITLFTKTFKDNRGEELYEHQLYLWQWSSEKGILFDLAKPLGYHAPTRTLWQEALPGRPALENPSQLSKPEFLETVAKGLAQLHSSQLVSSKERRVEDCLNEAHDLRQTLEQHLPQFSSPLQTIVEKLEAKAPQFTFPLRPIHSAFRLKQLLLDGERVGVVDFDGFAMGDPCEDVTDFMADLQAHLPANSAEKARYSFLESYRAHVPWTLTPQSLEWHSALKWLERAHWLRYQLDLEGKRKAVTSKIQLILEWTSNTLAWFAFLLQNMMQEIPYELI